jgi:serine/threonine-protein kinase
MKPRRNKVEFIETELTEVGVPYGTATYAAPEQAMGSKVDARADIFSTGVLLYEMLTGTWPFRGKTTVEVRYAVIHGAAKPLSEARPGPTPTRLQENSRQGHGQRAARSLSESH